MRRIAACLCLIATASLLPVQAEAARFRLGGRSVAAPAKMSRGTFFVPGVGTARPERVPFPPATARREEAPPLRLSTADAPRKPWCGGETVVGGFCVVN